MKNFKEYLEEKEDIMNEDAAAIIGSVLGYGTVGVISAWGLSLLALGGAKVYKKVVDNLSKTKEYLGISTDKIKKEVKKPAVQQALNKTEEKKKKFEDKLEDLYSAIKEKDYDKAHEEYVKTPRELRYNPEVTQSIIEEITKVEGEPPIWIQTPGNVTYRAIRKVTDVRIAKAAAQATKIGIQNLGVENGK